MKLYIPLCVDDLPQLDLSIHTPTWCDHLYLCVLGRRRAILLGLDRARAAAPARASAATQHRTKRHREASPEGASIRCLRCLGGRPVDGRARMLSRHVIGIGRSIGQPDLCQTSFSPASILPVSLALELGSLVGGAGCQLLEVLQEVDRVVAR